MAAPLETSSRMCRWCGARCGVCRACRNAPPCGAPAPPSVCWQYGTSTHRGPGWAACTNGATSVATSSSQTVARWRTERWRRRCGGCERIGGRPRERGPVYRPPPRRVSNETIPRRRRDAGHGPCQDRSSAVDTGRVARIHPPPAHLDSRRGRGCTATRRNDFNAGRVPRSCAAARTASTAPRPSAGRRCRHASTGSPAPPAAPMPRRRRSAELSATACLCRSAPG